MQLLSLSSEYAIRALTLLAQRHGEGGGYHLAREMARELIIPPPFLGKILASLAARGVLDSQRGRGGGFRLARPPGEVTLYDVVAAQEPLDRPRRCVLGQAECTDQRACPLHDFWKQRAEEWLARLADTTLSDLVRFCAERPDCGYPVPGGD